MRRLLAPARRERTIAAACLCLALMLASLPVRIAAAQAPANGFWDVQGRALPGTRCSDWFVRLGMRQGDLTGIVGVGQGNLIIQNLVLQPNGSFSGNTRAGHVNGRAVRAYNVAGQFSGDRVSVTLTNEICPDRTGTGFRQ
jgi:hypothetical protein